MTNVKAQSLREPLIMINLSLPRRRESSDVKNFWIPAFAGMTFLEVALNFEIEVKAEAEVKISKQNFKP